MLLCQHLLVLENSNMLEGCFHFMYISCKLLFCMEWMVDRVGYNHIESIMGSISGQLIREQVIMTVHIILKLDIQNI